MNHKTKHLALSLLAFAAVAFAAAPDNLLKIAPGGTPIVTELVDKADLQKAQAELSKTKSELDAANATITELRQAIQTLIAQRDREVTNRLNLEATVAIERAKATPVPAPPPAGEKKE